MLIRVAAVLGTGSHPFGHLLFMARSICLYPYYRHIKTRYLTQNQITIVVFGKMKSIRFARFAGFGKLVKRSIGAVLFSFIENFI